MELTKKAPKIQAAVPLKALQRGIQTVLDTHRTLLDRLQKLSGRSKTQSFCCNALHPQPRYTVALRWEQRFLEGLRVPQLADGCGVLSESELVLVLLAWRWDQRLEIRWMVRQSAPPLLADVTVHCSETKWGDLRAAKTLVAPRGRRKYRMLAGMPQSAPHAPQRCTRARWRHRS